MNRNVLVVAVLLSHVCFALGGYWLASNHHIANSSQGKTRQSLFKILDSAQSMQLSRYEDQIFQQTQSLVLAQKTIETLEQENLALHQKSRDVEQEVELFRRVVKGQQETKGLSIGKMALTKGSNEDYELSLDVIQMSGSQRVRGNLFISIEGHDGNKRGQWATIPLHLGDTAKDKHKRLDFTNFQKIKVAVRLPKHFKPEQIIVEAKFTRGKKVNLSKRFDWRVQGAVQ